MKKNISIFLLLLCAVTVTMALEQRAEIPESEKITRFGHPAVLCNLLVKGLLQTGCLQVCQDATINGNLTVKGTITTNNQTAFLQGFDVSSTSPVPVLSITVNEGGTYFAIATMSAFKNAGDNVNIRLLKNATLGTQPQIVTTDVFAIGAPTALATQGFFTVNAGDTIDLFAQVDPITNYALTEIRLSIMRIS